MLYLREKRFELRKDKGIHKFPQHHFRHHESNTSLHHV